MNSVHNLKLPRFAKLLKFSKTTFRSSLMLAIFCGLSFLACKKDAAKTGPITVVLETQTLQKSEGPDCAKPDSLRTNCLELDLEWPAVKTGTDALKKGVAEWANYFMASVISPFSDDEKQTPATVEAASKELVKSHQDFIKDAEGSPMGYWTAESSFDSLLNDGKYLTLELNAYTYFGGAHGSPLAAVATFDAQTGKRLQWDDLVTDQKALEPLVEKAFRADRDDLFQPTDGNEPYEFSETFPFALPQNYGLTGEGLYCHYLHYEVGPYAIGNTVFTIPFEELGSLLKAQQPSPQVSNVEEGVLDIYGEEGTSIIIPTFEIEVAQSPKAKQLLGKQKETTIVAAYFSGEPKSERDMDDIGMMNLADKQVELTGENRIARFEGLKFSKTEYAKLADKDIHLLINVYSGRKSSEDNLLNCGLLDMKASQFMGKRFVLRCQTIEETPPNDTSMVHPFACYSLPQPNQPPTLLVTCSEKGEIHWAGRTINDYDALMAAIRPVLMDLKKSGAKELPALETQGCLMGNGGEIRTRYDELVAEVMGKAKATPTKYEVAEKPKTPQSSTTKPDVKTAAKPSTKPAAKPTALEVTLNQKGEITLAGKKVAMENLRKELQAALSASANIPDKLELKTIGETGMGTRAEVNTIINESIAGAKWVRKKAAIEALNSPVGKKLGTATQLEIGTYQTNGAFAYIKARPKKADGKAIDYSKTSYAKDAQSKSFSDSVIGLLKYENGKWQMVTYSIGVAQPPVDIWVKNYKIPKTMLGT